MPRSTAPLSFVRQPPEQMLASACSFYEQISRRRSVRHFSDEPVPLEVIDECIRAAGTSPSGAHLQPWTFCLVTDPDLKSEIRAAAEREERLLYEERITDEWREALEPIGTDACKPFLEVAPVLIVVMRHTCQLGPQGETRANYYSHESIGIAVGILLTALHLSGLATLTHTPSPMGFLSDILERPANERAYLVIPVGYPVADCQVPDLQRKPLPEIRVRYGS